MNRPSGEKLACIWSDGEYTSLNGFLLSPRGRSHTSVGYPLAKAMCFPSGDQSEGAILLDASARCTRDIIWQQLLIVATSARALLIQRYHTFPIAPKDNPVALRGPDRGGVEVDHRTKRKLLFAAPYQVDQPDVGNAHLRIDQRSRYARFVRREPKVRVVVFAVRTNHAQRVSRAVEPGEASRPEAGARVGQRPRARR